MQKPDGADGLVTINPLTDSELLASAAEQDTLAFEQLYARYSPTIYSLIKKIVSDKESAEKILVEVFLIFWKRIEDFNKENLFTGLVLLTRNKTLDYMKRKHGNTILPEYEDNYERYNIIPNLSNKINPLKLQNALKIKYEIGEMIKGLTDAQRYVLSLFYFDGLDENEISQKLKIPLPTVRSKLQVATDILLEKTRTLESYNG
ncbi:MAG: sigma-70 family RNA polymerase sigma factor [Ignavibacteria bacterium]|nr:sigma-70 family RNA polymerase sigma factor [Ignavibacteria bacterium]